MIRALKLVIVFVLLAEYCQAANDSVSYPRLNKDYIRSYFSDSWQLVRSPGKWHTKELVTFGVVASAGVLAYTQDQRVQQYFTNHRNEIAHQSSKYIFEPFGSGLGSGILVGGLFIGGTLAHNERVAGTALTAVKSFAIASLGTGIFKQIAHRHRPFQDPVPDRANWDGPFSKFSYTSFPSGHSTAAFSVATVFAMEYRETIWVPVLSYTLAAGTAISRLYDNRHWLSDVVIGSAFGFFTGRFIWKQSCKRANSVRVYPEIGTETSALHMVIPIRGR